MWWMEAPQDTKRAGMGAIAMGSFVGSLRLDEHSGASDAREDSSPPELSRQQSVDAAAWSQWRSALRGGIAQHR